MDPCDYREHMQILRHVCTYTVVYTEVTDSYQNIYCTHIRKKIMSFNYRKILGNKLTC